MIDDKKPWRITVVVTIEKEVLDVIKQDLVCNRLTHRHRRRLWKYSRKNIRRNPLK